MKRFKLYVSIFVVFFAADFLECYLKTIEFFNVYAPIKPVLISIGITFSVNNFLKDISKNSVVEDFRKNLLLSSDSVRSQINSYFASLKTLFERSIVDADISLDQLKEDRKQTYGYVKSMKSKWNKIEKLLQGEKK